MSALVRSLAVGAVLLATLTPVAVRAQDPSLTIDDVNDANYPDIDLTVTVPSNITTQLTSDAFTVTENDREVQPSFGATPDAESPAPPKVVLAIDVSGSMRASIDQAKRAATSFVESLPDDSQVALVTFGDEARTLVRLTSNRDAVANQIAGIIADDDSTALYAGVQESVGLLAAGGGQPTSIVVLSDGKDTADGDADAAIQSVQDRGIQLWAVALPGEDGEPANVDNLRALAGDGGRVVPAGDAGQLTAIYDSVAANLARTYVLRYRSEADGSTDISVTLQSDVGTTEQSVIVDIDAGGAEAAQEPEPVTAVDPAVSTVTVPLLGQTPAFVVGMVALTIGSLILLLHALAPRRKRMTSPRQRLIIGQQPNLRQTATRLTSIAHWTTEVTDRRLRRGSLGARLDKDLEGAGLNLRPGELVIVVLSMMVVAYAIGTVTVNPLFGLILVPMPPLLVRLWLGMRRDKRRASFADQLTDVLQLIGSSLRAGYGLTQGIDAVSRDAEDPAASEFRRIIVEHRLGRDLNEAMDNCATRMDNADFSWVVQAIAIHRDVGGDLSKVLDNIIATIRDRADVNRQVRTLSAEGRMSARVLTGMPILVLITLVSTSPDYMAPLFENAIGIILLGLSALLMLIGVLVMRRMSNIRY